MSFSADIHNIFVLTLALFTLGAMMLATYTVANAVRLRNIRISWKSGKLGGYPLFSTLFLIFSAGMATLMYTHQISPFFPIMACYVWLGFCWFVSSYFTSKSYITDLGIVKNINDPSQTIAWHQISDYVEKPAAKGSEFVFIYQSAPQRTNQKRLIRLELFVPDKKTDKFNKIIDLKIGKTMTPVVDTSFDFKAFD